MGFDCDIDKIGERLFDMLKIGDKIEKIVGFPVKIKITPSDNHETWYFHVISVDKHQYSNADVYSVMYEKTVAGWTFNVFPGCWSMIIFNNVYTHQEYEGKGIGKMLLAFRINLAKLCGFDAALATASNHNGKEASLLIRAGFNTVEYAVQNMSKLTFRIYMRDLTIHGVQYESDGWLQ